MNQPRRSVVQGFVALPIGALSLRRERPAATVTVFDGPELQAALRVAGRGTVITLAPGDYRGPAELVISAPDVTLRAAEPLRTVLRPPVVVTGANARLLDLAFHGEGDDGVYLSAEMACSDSLSISAPDVEVSGCDFGFFPARAILVRPSGLRPYIHDCTFHDSLNDARYHDAHSAVTLGFSNPTSRVSMKGRVINNELWSLNVEGSAITVKTSDNLVQDNQLRDSRGGFICRYGTRNIFRGNTSTNSRGFVIADLSNRVVENKILGRGSIRIRGGNADVALRLNGPHLQATKTYLQDNFGPLVIGFNYSGETLPALDTYVQSHVGAITLRAQTGTRLPG
jgi:hypothetical protein